MQYKKLGFLFYLSLIICNLQAQRPSSEFNFSSPVNYPILLSGNYGELRSSHFHAGIDIKTGGVIGKNIYSIEDGYISRIKISIGGYGKTLYINHPNGYTSVYAHLDKFNSSINDFVKDLQYEENTFEINYFPKKEDFPIKKGELIAISGNTGSSKGPHLHFEIRNTSSQIPLNPLLYNFDIIDNIAPKIYAVTLYPLSKDSYINNQTIKNRYVVSKSNGVYALKDTSEILVSGKIGIGIELNDFLDGSRNKCGIYNLSVTINDETIYSHEIDSISFAETGYIKSHVDHEEKIRNKRTIQKTFIDPNNNLTIYKTRINNGIYNFTKDSIYNIKLIANDVYGNKSILKFQVKGRIKDFIGDSSYEEPKNLMKWDQENSFSNENIKILIPKLALYDNLLFNFSESEHFQNSLTPVYNIHDESVPLHKRFSLSINIDNFNQSLMDKLFIANIDSDGEINPIGGEVVNNTITSTANEFGRYTVMVDTLNPRIEPTIKNESLLIEEKIEFIIKDNLSGIKSYNAYIDNEWALFEFDTKNDLIFYEIDSKRLNKNQEHELELFVIDNTGNISTYYTTFYW